MPNNITRLFDVWLQKDPKRLYLWQNDAEFHARVRRFRTALGIAYYAMKADKQKDTEAIIDILFEGLPDGSETS